MALWRVMPQASVDDERKIGRKGILATESTNAKLEAKLGGKCLLRVCWGPMLAGLVGLKLNGYGDTDVDATLMLG